MGDCEPFGIPDFPKESWLLVVEEEKFACGELELEFWEETQVHIEGWACSEENEPWPTQQHPYRKRGAPGGPRAVPAQTGFLLKLNETEQGTKTGKIGGGISLGPHALIRVTGKSSLLGKANMPRRQSHSSFLGP